MKVVPRTLCCFHWTFWFESWMLLTGENIVTFLLRKYLVIVSNEMTRATVINVLKSFLLILSLHLSTGFLLVVSVIVIKYFYRSHHNVHWTSRAFNRNSLKTRQDPLCLISLATMMPSHWAILLMMTLRLKFLQMQYHIKDLEVSETFTV